jgi:hypothetical protein
VNTFALLVGLLLLYGCGRSIKLLRIAWNYFAEYMDKKEEVEKKINHVRKIYGKDIEKTSGKKGKKG